MLSSSEDWSSSVLIALTFLLSSLVTLIDGSSATSAFENPYPSGHRLNTNLVLNPNCMFSKHYKLQMTRK